MEGKENLPERPRRKIVLAQATDRKTPSYLMLGQNDMQETRINIRHDGSKTHRTTLSMGALPDRSGRSAERLVTIDNSEHPTEQSQLDLQQESLNRKRHQRLAEITDRCVEYKRRFLKQLQSQVERFDLIFKVNR